MSKIVSTSQQAIRNIHKFYAEVSRSPELQDRLSYARAWYATKHEGEWYFGPSKFIGYLDMTAQEYLNDEPRDGRQTENKLKAWFRPVPEGSPLYEELSTKLGEFLERHGKAPSKAMRINVLEENLDDGEGRAFEKAVVNLIVAVASRLPASERARLKSAL